MLDLGWFGASDSMSWVNFYDPRDLMAAARPAAPCRWHSAAGQPDFGVSPGFFGTFPGVNWSIEPHFSRTIHFV